MVPIINRQPVYLLSVISLSMSGMTHAQTQVKDQESTSPLEIIVTAPRRPEALRMTPYAISVIKGSQAEALELYDLKSMQSLVPSLIITSTANEAQSTARLRGVGTVGDNPGLESSVGIMIDGVMRARTATGLSDLGQVDRVEVLKGPQSGLYGKGASAGLIAVFSKKPSASPHQSYSLSLGEYGMSRLSMAMEGPIFQGLNGSFTAFSAQKDGQYRVKTGEGPRTETRDNNQNLIGFKAQLATDLGEELSARLFIDYLRRDEFCCSGTSLSIGSTRAYVDLLASDEGTALVVDPSSRLSFSNRSTKQYIEDWGVSLSLSLNQVLGGQVNTITAFRTYDHFSGYDADFSSADIYYRDPDGAFGNRFFTLSQEISWDKKGDDYGFQLGFLADHESLRRKDQTLYGADYESYLGLLLSGGVDINRVSSLTGLVIGQSYILGDGARDIHRQSTRNWSFFGSGYKQISPDLSILGSFRHLNQDKKVSSEFHNSDNGRACQAAINLSSTGLGVLCLPWSNPAFNQQSLAQSNKYQSLTGSLKLRYVSGHHMAYLSAATGFKGAGFNLDREQIGTSLMDRDTLFKAERSAGLEMGYRRAFKNGQWSLIGFDQNFKDFQLNTFIGTTFLVRSVPILRSKGFELEGRKVWPAVGITLDGGIVYNHARFGPEAVAGLSLLSDNRPSFAPRWSANMNAQWDGQWKGIRLTGLMTLRHLGPHNTGSDLAPIKVQRGFALYNGSFELSKGSWGVSLWGQNLSNEVAQQVVFSAPFQTGSFHGFSYAPRTLGIRLRYR